MICNYVFHIYVLLLFVFKIFLLGLMTLFMFCIQSSACRAVGDKLWPSSGKFACYVKLVKIGANLL